MPKRKKNFCIEPLQDLSVSTSLPDATFPHDSSLMKEILNYDISLENVTVNNTQEINIHSGPYPPDSTFMDTSSKEEDQVFKKPFIKNSKKSNKPRSNLFDSILENSDHNTSDQDLQRPFRRKAKVSVNYDCFDSDSNDNLHDSKPNTLEKKAERPFFKKRTVPITSNCFDIDTSNDSPNISNIKSNFITRRNTGRRRQPKPLIFDEVLDSASSNGVEKGDENKFPVMCLSKRRKTRQIDTVPDMFDSIVNNSLQKSARNVSLNVSDEIVSTNDQHETEKSWSTSSREYPFNHNKARQKTIESGLFDSIIDTDSLQNSADDVHFNNSNRRESSNKKSDTEGLASLSKKHVFHRTKQNKFETDIFDDVIDSLNNSQHSVTNASLSKSIPKESTSKKTDNDSTVNAQTYLGNRFNNKQNVAETGLFDSILDSSHSLQDSAIDASLYKNKLNESSLRNTDTDTSKKNRLCRPQSRNAGTETGLFDSIVNSIEETEFICSNTNQSVSSEQSRPSQMCNSSINKSSVKDTSAIETIGNEYSESSKQPLTNIATRVSDINKQSRESDIFETKNNEEKIRLVPLNDAQICNSSNKKSSVRNKSVIEAIDVEYSLRYLESPEKSHQYRENDKCKIKSNEKNHFKPTNKGENYISVDTCINEAEIERHSLHSWNEKHAESIDRNEVHNEVSCFTLTSEHKELKSNKFTTVDKNSMPVSNISLNTEIYTTNEKMSLLLKGNEDFGREIDYSEAQTESKVSVTNICDNIKDKRRSKRVSFNRLSSMYLADHSEVQVPTNVGNLNNSPTLMNINNKSSFLEPLRIDDISESLSLLDSECIELHTSKIKSLSVITDSTLQNINSGYISTNTESAENGSSMEEPKNVPENFVQLSKSRISPDLLEQKGVNCQEYHERTINGDCTGRSIEEGTSDVNTNVNPELSLEVECEEEFSSRTKTADTLESEGLKSDQCSEDEESREESDEEYEEDLEPEQTAEAEEDVEDEEIQSEEAMESDEESEEDLEPEQSVEAEEHVEVEGVQSEEAIESNEESEEDLEPEQSVGAEEGEEVQSEVAMNKEYEEDLKSEKCAGAQDDVEDEGHFVNSIIKNSQQRNLGNIKRGEISEKTHEGFNRIVGSVKQKTRSKNVFKEPTVTLSKKEARDILNDIPLSEFKKKPKKPNIPSTLKEQLEQNKIEDGLNKRQKNGLFQRSAQNRLKKPRKWIKQKMYNVIISKLESQFGLRSRLRAEKLVFLLVEHVDNVLKTKGDYFAIVEEMKNELARLKIIKTHLDFRCFVKDYFDADFVDKVYPRTRDAPTNPYQPEDIYADIL